MPRVAYVSGRYVQHQEAQVHIEDRGLQFADSVYEVVALVNGHFMDEQGHLDRLARSMSELKMTGLMPRAAFKLVMRELVRRNRLQNGALYIQITRGAAPRDFKFPKTAALGVIMTLRPATFDIPARKNAVKSIITLPDIRWQRRDIKTTGLLAQVLAKQAALDAGADDAWMVDGAGKITEASASNAWIVTAKGELVTRPTAGNAILKGVTRNAMQALCKKHKIKFIERAFTPAEARSAKEAFMSSAVALIVPVCKIDGKKIGNGKTGPVTSKIFDLYMQYATDQKSKQEKWSAT